MRKATNNHPWDGYCGEDIILFDDFDSRRVSINDLLHWIDIYPCKLDARYSEKVACYTKVFFTSNYSPQDLWSEEYRWNIKTFEALMRRIHVVKRFFAFGKYEIEKKDGFLTVSDQEQNQIDMMFGK